jgi:two-component system NtrC family sensor kinase
MKNDLRILLLEDMPPDAALIEREIRKSYPVFQMCCVATQADFSLALSEFQPDVILSDYALPSFNGLKALELALEQAPETPFIIVTGALSEETAVECMKQGSWDYILKDRLVRIVPAIDAALEKKKCIEEKNLAKEALEKSRSRYLNFFESSPALIWRSDPSGSIDYFNRNWLAFTGCSIEQEINGGWTENIHPDDRADALKDLHDAFASKVPFESEFRLRNHAGDYRRIQVFGRPFIDEDGSYSGHIGYNFDKTERFETEEVLRKLSRAVEQSTSAILITDTEGTIEYANASFSSLSGYSLENLIGANARTTSNHDTVPDVFGESWQTVKTEGKWSGERINRKKSGEPYWELATISSINNADDLTTHYLVELEEITRRKETERELTESRTELQRNHEALHSLFNQVAASKREWESTMDCIGDMVILVTGDGKIKRCNKAVREFTALPYQEILGAPWREFLNRHGLNLPQELSHGCEIHHDSSGRWFFCTSYPYTDNQQNQKSGFVLTMHDFTRRKTVGDELENAYRELKSTQAKIVQQEKMASIGQLAAGVAHEINNPIGFISSNLGSMKKYLERLTGYVNEMDAAIELVPDEGYRQTFRERKKALKIDYIIEDGRDLLDESLDGAERVRSIVQNLKSFSRVDESECKSADINECLESTLNIVWNELKYKATLVRDLGPLPQIRCFPQQLNQVFMNLLVNAVQAIENQGEIRVRTWQEGTSVYASVSDTGCGIPDHVLSKIFEPFYTTKEVGKGTGLGLSITYDIIKKHQGEIFVESRPGEGSTFTIRLPIQ